MSQSELAFPKPLIEKYAPKQIEDFIGLPKVKRVLRNFLRKPVECSWLFHGPSGRGKTEMGRVMAAALGAQWHHIPAARCDQETIENVCRLCHYVPFNFTTGFPAKWHLVQVDESDRATPNAQVALLSKTDATAHPPQTIFVFTANNLALEARFLSRCRVLRFDADGMIDELPRFLARVATAEMCPIDIDFAELAKSVNYNVRDAMNRLEVELLGAGYIDASKAVEANITAEDRAEQLRKRFDVREYGDKWLVACRKCKRSWPCILPITEKSYNWLIAHDAQHRVC